MPLIGRFGVLSAYMRSVLLKLWLPWADWLVSLRVCRVPRLLLTNSI